jgi:ABC-2 type transport system permease protein
LFITSAWGLFQILWMTMIVQKVSSFQGWTRDEMLLIAANYIFIFCIFHMFFSRNFDRLAYIVNKGDFDLLLVKPVDSQFTATLWIFNYATIVRILIGFGFVVFFYVKLGIPLTFLSVINWLVLIAFAIVLNYSLWLMLSSIIIVNPKLTNITELLYNLNGLARFPPDMIFELRNFILLVLVPFTLSAAIPTKALFNRLITRDVVLLLVLSIILFIASRLIWNRTLRLYTSSSS